MKTRVIGLKKKLVNKKVKLKVKVNMKYIQEENLPVRYITSFCNKLNILYHEDFRLPPHIIVKFFRLFGSIWIYGRINFQGIQTFDTNIYFDVKGFPFTSKTLPSFFVQFEIAFAILSL